MDKRPYLESDWEDNVNYDKKQEPTKSKKVLNTFLIGFLILNWAFQSGAYVISYIYVHTKAWELVYV